jgi:GNAT superfamily N-acetyltransferase
MRMWRPERAHRGPFPVTERDVPALNRLFADAFTDRYRRDGLVGVRVPFLNEAIWRYAIEDAGGGAMLWRDEGDRLVGFNIAHCSGREGWMGPLCVRPDRQLGGLGKEIVAAAIEWLRARGVTTIGLETMPRTVDNIGFYSRLGFVPGHVTLTMTCETQQRGRRGALPLLGGRNAAARRDTIAAAAALVDGLLPGVDFTREIELTLALELGEVVLVEREGRLDAFALCHAAPLAEGGARDEVRVLKLAATDGEAFTEALELAGAWSQRLAIRRLAVRCQTADSAAYRLLVERGYRVRWSDLRMTLEGYPERRPERGIVWSNWEI